MCVVIYNLHVLPPWNLVRCTCARGLAENDISHTRGRSGDYNNSLVVPDCVRLNPMSLTALCQSKGRLGW